MYRLFILIPILFITTIISAQKETTVESEITSGAGFNTRIIEYQLVNLGGIGPVIKAVDNTLDDAETVINDVISTANEVPFINIQPATLKGVSEELNKTRTDTITNYFINTTARVYSDGVSASLTAEVASSSTHLVSIGLRASVALTPAIINQFGGDIEPVSLGRYAEFHLQDIISVGSSLSVNVESLFYNKEIEKSIDLTVRLPFTYDGVNNLFKIDAFAGVHIPVQSSFQRYFRVGVNYTY